MPSSEAGTATTETLMLRGRPQTLHIYGSRGQGEPVIVSSGDGGWMHLGPHVADLLAGAGYFVVGFDVRAYLASFTAGASSLQPGDVGRDYETLAAFASRGATAKPVLIGVSEGAGLSVLAAADARVKSGVAGVIALGLPDITELGWRWKDSVIYVTHGVPDEPTFEVAGVIRHIAPLPLAAIHSTVDEFAPLAEAERLFSLSGEPHRFWVVKAADHRFSGNTAEFDRRLLDAIVWVRHNQP
ncbi:MAG TPA: AcvB/VirJ family lysyl-phosphatidylglycerol hydrolase [Vicinamibacterales bacterium]|nr:AcvB/VirJ family lysyl-phosphatidylglycerol hydrolase [Vicinamibacterales bacterium]